MTTILVGSRERAMGWRQEHPDVDIRNVIVASHYETVAGLTLRADSEVVRLGGLSPEAESDVEWALSFALRVGQQPPEPSHMRLSRG